MCLSFDGRASRFGVGAEPSLDYGQPLNMKLRQGLTSLGGTGTASTEQQSRSGSGTHLVGASFDLLEDGTGQTQSIAEAFTKLILDALDGKRRLEAHELLGAAIQDFLNVIRRRFANIEIIIVPVKVQGDEATAEMVEAMDIINREIDADVIVLTRGGGSFEDLWAFNQEELALAIRASHIPVISAVGHEIDVTISDLAADLRAPTPSAAAELLVVEKEFLKERLMEIKGHLQSGLKTHLTNFIQRLILLSKGLHDPRKRIADSWIRLDEINSRIIRLMDLMIRERKKGLTSNSRALIFHSPVHICSPLRQKIEFQQHSLISMMTRRFKDQRMALFLFEGKIKDLNPLSILKRGYSITRKLPEKKVLKDVAGVEKGDHINVILAEGEMDCRIEKISSG